MCKLDTHYNRFKLSVLITLDPLLHVHAVQEVGGVKADLSLHSTPNSASCTVCARESPTR